jgi:hypothetical protein
VSDALHRLAEERGLHLHRLVAERFRPWAEAGDAHPDAPAGDQARVLEMIEADFKSVP